MQIFKHIIGILCSRIIQKKLYNNKKYITRFQKNVSDFNANKLLNDKK